MVNGWLSRRPRKNPGTWHRPARMSARRRRKMLVSEAASDTGGSGLSLRRGVSFRVRLGLREPGLQDFFALVAQMRAQDVRQAGAVTALQRVEDRFVLPQRQRPA